MKAADAPDHSGAQMAADTGGATTAIEVLRAGEVDLSGIAARVLPAPVAQAENHPSVQSQVRSGTGGSEYMRTVSELSDPELLNHYQHEGSEMAFRVLVLRYQALVLGAAYRRTGDMELARDVTQQVFAALARKAGLLVTRATVVGWLHQAAVYESMRALGAENRRRRKLTQFVAEQEPPVSAPQPQRDDQWGEVDQAIERLSPIDREAVLLHYFRDLSYTEMSKMLGITEPAARKRVSRALAQLGGHLRSRGIERNPVTVLTAAAAIQASLLLPTGTTQAALALAAVGGGSSSFLTLAALVSSATFRTAALVFVAAVPAVWVATSVPSAPQTSNGPSSRPAALFAMVDSNQREEAGVPIFDVGQQGTFADPANGGGSGREPSAHNAGGRFANVATGGRVASAGGGGGAAGSASAPAAGKTTAPQGSNPKATSPTVPTPGDPSNPTAPVDPEAPVIPKGPSDGMNPVASTPESPPDAPPDAPPDGTLPDVLPGEIADVYTDLVDEVVGLTDTERERVADILQGRLEDIALGGVVTPVLDQLGDVGGTLLHPLVLADALETALDTLPPEIVPPETVDTVLALGETVVQPILEPVMDTVVDPIVGGVVQPVVGGVVQPVVDTVVKPVVDTVLQPVKPVVQPVISTVDDTLDKVTKPLGLPIKLSPLLK